MPKSQSQTKKLPIQNFAILIVAFLLIGMMLGPNVNQVYSGISATGSDTVELTNDGNLDTKVRDFSLSQGPFLAVSDSSGTVSQFTHRTQIGLTHFGVLTDYQKLLTVSYDPLMQADFNDIRFTDSAGEHIPYWVGSQTDGSTADVWIKNDYVDGDTYVWMYYGNDVLSSGSSGDDTFMFFDDFNRDLSKWDGYMAGASISDGVLTYAGDGASWGVLSSIQTFDDPIIIEIRGKITNSGYGGLGVRDQSGNIAQLLYSGTGEIIQHGDGITYPYISTDFDISDWHTYKIIWLSNNVHYFEDDVELLNSPYNTNNPESSTSAVGFTSYSGNVYGDFIFVREYTSIEPTYSIGEAQQPDVIDPGIAVGDDRLYYDEILSSTIIYSDDSAYIDTSDVSASMKGSLPIIKVGATQNIKIDHDLQYSITYVPKNMDITSPDMFRANEDMRIDTRLTDTSGNPVSNQPLEMRARLFDSNDDRYLDEIISSTSFVIPGKYIKSGKHYQLRLSYNGFEFGGWSNEILADFDVGTEGFTITSSPDKAPEGLAAASFAAASNLVGMAVTGWLDIPIIGDIIKFIADFVGVTL